MRGLWRSIGRRLDGGVGLLLLVLVLVLLLLLLLVALVVLGGLEDVGRRGAW